MKIRFINVRDDDGSYRPARSAFAGRGFGFGKLPARKPGRELSLASVEALEEVSGLDGLCVKKFMADLVTQGVDYGELSPGTRLQAGEAVFEICTVGKRCFPECSLEQKPCALAGGCAFAQVKEEGSVRIGDEIRIISAEDGN